MLTFTEHAEDQMQERDVDVDEVYEIFRRSRGGVKGKRKNTFEVHGTTSHNRRLTIVYTRRARGPHVITVINHSLNQKRR